MVITPSEQDFRNIYTLMVGTIVPRPIAFVSTLDADGIPNLAPFSFFTIASINPPVVCFCPVLSSRSSEKKDTLSNVEATGDFVVNTVSEDIAQEMSVASAKFPSTVDEFTKSGLTPVSSDLVKAPRVKESRIAMECKLLQVVHVSSRPMGGSLVLGEVVRFHVHDDLVSDFRINHDLFRPIGRMAGNLYVRTTDTFEIQRPRSEETPS